MPAVQWHLDPTRLRATGAIRSYRYGLFRPGNSRFVIDLAKPVTLGDALVLPPEHGYGYRVVVDLYPTTQPKFDTTAGWPQDLKAREAAAERLASLAPAPQKPADGLAQKKVIIIDPGHGGLDSGTSGVNGVLEKDLVLDEGLRLARLLEKSGPFIVHLTRDSDIYVPLSERVGIARSWHADLFISLHADSNPDSSVSGLSVYTLSSSASDRQAAALARKENQSDVIAGVDLGGENSQVAPILIDLAQRDTLNRSSHFALAALERLSAATDILARDPHRSAGFMVLKAPDVPAVLIELGYLSNPHDAARMATASWRDGVAFAIARAVERQFSTQAALEPSGESTP
jgi:N-acetylmuramoyl-L-alanine amidase